VRAPYVEFDDKGVLQSVREIQQEVEMTMRFLTTSALLLGLAATPGLAAEATTETQSQTEANTQASVNPSSTIVPAQKDGEWLAASVIGADVYNSKDESIGEISNLIVSPQGKVTGAVIGVGGFLGIGEKRVGVAFDALEARETQTGAKRWYIQLSREQLDTAPALETVAMRRAEEARARLAEEAERLRNEGGVLKTEPKQKSQPEE